MPTSNLNELYENLNGICYIIIFVALFITFISFNFVSKYSLQTNIGCYITILLVITFLFMTNISIQYIPINTGLNRIFSNIDTSYFNKIISGLLYLIRYTGPFLIFIISMIIFIYSISNNFDKISSGHVSGYYYAFSYLFLFLLITQSTVLFYNRANEVDKPMSNKLYMLLLLFSTISGISVISLNIVLNFFTTDG